ncbi:chaperonin 10-like protein [Mycena galericulata]|nr:chaperonin 10-like protein [Mycena galericulata]
MEDPLKLKHTRMVLLLHGPRQKYALEKAKDIPSIQSDDEILIQVLAIGLNPIDWKGPDFGFGQPSYPWINGRDFAGIVVTGPRKESLIKSGDIVFGPSTNYRDLRRAAFQEYVVTTDHNVARLPAGTTVKAGAVIGVAFVAAVLGLSISLGIDFSALVSSAPSGSDFYHLVRSLDRSHFPEDVRAEVFDYLPLHQRPKLGDWVIIWGGQLLYHFALQLAKLAGYRVISVIDVAKKGKLLMDCGADVLVDRYDQSRAVAAIRNITDDQLRLAIDATGKKASATILQDVLQTSKADQRRHLLGFSGLPNSEVPNVQQHKVPIKIFHTVPQVGEALMIWLEKLLIAEALKMPEVDVADGGLAGVNAALDKMRSGLIRI